MRSLLAALTSVIVCAPSPAQNLPLPTPQQAAWHDLEIGMFIHFAPNTWQDQEYDDLSTPLDQIDPAALDTDQWVRIAKDMNAGYIVFVAKHVGGFCWWPTETTDYSVRNIAWRNGKGDVMRDLAESCKEAGIGLGVYLSPADRSLKVGFGGKAEDPADQAAYEKVFRAQLTELLTGYGDIMEVWFDGSLAFEVGDILEAHAPDAVVFQGPHASIRWVGNEEGVAPYPAWNAVRYDPETWGTQTARDGDPDGDRWLPNECDARIRNTWFWRTDNAHTLKSLDQLMDMYHRSVGHGAVLLLNHTPDPTGAIPKADAQRSKEFGDEIDRRYATPIVQTTGRGDRTDLYPSAPVTIDAAIIQEDITKGERIRAYRLEALTETGWTTISQGTAVGHKKIDRFDPIKVSQIRLIVTKSAAEPIVRSLAVFDTR